MEFKDILNQYIVQLGCTASELSNACGLSASVLSRYRSGERLPKQDDEAVFKLAETIASIAQSQNISNLNYDTVLAALRNALKSNFGTTAFSRKIDLLITELNINVSHMSNHMGYDASFISRIRTGKRMPGDVQDCILKLSLYIIKNCNTKSKQDTLCKILNADMNSITDSAILSELLQCWLSANALPSENYIFSFIQKLDEFDLNDYIHSIHFDEPVFMCADMDMNDMAKDSEFSKKMDVRSCYGIKEKSEYSYYPQSESSVSRADAWSRGMDSALYDWSGCSLLSKGTQFCYLPASALCFRFLCLIRRMHQRFSQ